MPLTNFPSGVSSFGLPVFGGGGWSMPTLGTYFFVDPANGSDSNSGTDASAPLASVSAALDKATSGKNDVIFLFGNGQASGSARQSTTLTWSKDATHLIGVAAPTAIAGRARIAQTSGVDVSPLVTVSGDGCMFANIHMFQGYDTSEAQICLNVTGERNYFVNCHIAGMGVAEAGDHAGSSSLSLTGDGENTFESCTIGLDTIPRSTTNAEIDLKSAAVRNVFRNCMVLAYADNGGHLFVKADGSGDLDRFVLFDNCMFVNATNSAATSMTAAISAHASAGGHIIIKDCWLAGAADWTAADNTVVRLCGATPGTATGDIANIGIAQDVDVTPA